MQVYPWNSLEFMKHTTIDVGSEQLSVARNRPDRPPELLLLHGVLRDWRSFYSILPALAADLSIAALDFRGHGGSTAHEPYYVVDYLSDALQVLRRLPEPCAVYGHSLGAMVALAAAAAEPERVKGLVLEDPPFSTMGEDLHTLPLMTYFEGVEECLKSQRSPDNELMYEAFSGIIVGTGKSGEPIHVRDQRDETSRRFSSECLMYVDPSVLQPITAGRWLEGYSLGQILDQVRCPVEVLQADAQCGGMLTDRDAALISGKLGQLCRLHHFPGTGHSVHWSRPEDVIASVRRLVG